MIVFEACYFNLSSLFRSLAASMSHIMLEGSFENGFFSQKKEAKLNIDLSIDFQIFWIFVLTTYTNC